MSHAGGGQDEGVESVQDETSVEDEFGELQGDPPQGSSSEGIGVAKPNDPTEPPPPPTGDEGVPGGARAGTKANAGKNKNGTGVPPRRSSNQAQKDLIEREKRQKELRRQAQAQAREGRTRQRQAKADQRQRDAEFIQQQAQLERRAAEAFVQQEREEALNISITSSSTEGQLRGVARRD